MGSPASHQICGEAFGNCKAVTPRSAYCPFTSLELPLWMWTLVFRCLPSAEVSTKLQWREKVIIVLSVEGKKIKERSEMMCHPADQL